MDVAKAGQIVVVMLSPTLAVAAAIYVPRALGAVLRMVGQGRHPERPGGPPIEELAADLRRLLHAHDSLKRSSSLAMRAHRLRAVEAAITDCATDAARALGVPVPQQPAHSGLPTRELRRLLRALADAGMVLPSSVDLLTNDRHR
jgi:hypothetical protein